MKRKALLQELGTQLDDELSPSQIIIIIFNEDTPLSKFDFQGGPNK